MSGPWLERDSVVQDYGRGCGLIFLSKALGRGNTSCSPCALKTSPLLVLLICLVVWDMMVAVEWHVHGFLQMVACVHWRLIVHQPSNVPTSI